MTAAPTPAEHEARLWASAEPMLAQPGVTRSTMMGLPCLRIDGRFFGSFDRRTGDLLVKLPAALVDQLVGARRAHSFARGRPAVPGVGGHQPHPAAKLAGAARGSPRLRRLATAATEEAQASAFVGFPPDAWAFLTGCRRSR